MDTELGPHEIQASHRLLAAVVRSLPDAAVVVVDLELRILVVAGPPLSARGWDTEGLVGEHLRDVLPETELRLLEPYYRAATRGRRASLTSAGVTAQTATFETEFSPLRDGEGEIFGAVAVIREVTERVQQQQALEHSEREYRLLAENATDMISRHASDGTYLYVSPACRELLGREPEEMIGRSAYDFFAPDDIPGLRERHDMILDSGEPLVTRMRLRRHDGTYVWTESLSRIVHGPDGAIAEIHSATRDATEMVRAEEAERAALRRFERGFSDAPVGMVLSEGTRVTQVNRSLAELLGRSADELVAGGLLAVTHPDDVDLTVRHLDRVSAGEPSTIDKRYLHASGDVIWVQIRAVPVHDEATGQSYAVAHVIDVTAEHRAREARAALQRSFETAFSEAPTGIALVGLDGCILRVNRACCELLGRGTSELVGLSAFDVNHPEDRDADKALIRELLDGATTSYQLEKRFVTRDGLHIWALLSVSLVRDASGEPEHFITQLQDISARKRAERSLRHMADHDPLTGVTNRRRFDQELDEQVMRSRRDDETAVLVLIDVDGLKDVNDRHGHHAGDELLRHTAHALRNRLRAGDVVARLGGDEFAVLVSDVPPGEAPRIADAVCDAIRGEVRVGDDLTVAASASAGFAVVDRSTLTAAGAMVVADRAMYEAKGRGGDRAAGHAPGRPPAG